MCISLQQINYYHLICICQTLKKKWTYNGAVHKLFIDFKKAYDSVRKKVTELVSP